MRFGHASILLGACTLLVASAASAQVRTSGSGIPISKDRPSVSTTAGGTVALEINPPVLPAFMLASYPALTEKNITALMAAGDSLEIQLGELAHSKGTAQSVRDFGGMLAGDHRAHLTKTMEIITDEDVGVEPLANDIEGARLRGMLAWLQSNGGNAAWDAAFLRFQAQHHQNVYDLLSANIKNAHDDDLEEHIEKTLLSLAKHRDVAISTATALGMTF